MNAGDLDSVIAVEGWDLNGYASYYEGKDIIIAEGLDMRL